MEITELPEYSLGEISVPMVSVSAAKTEDGELLLALVNLDPADGVTIETELGDSGVKEVTGRTLTADAMDAQNTFDEPENVKPAEIDVALDDGVLSVDLPAKSVTVLRVR